MILIYKTKPEHIKQPLFSGFEKYEQINKLAVMQRRTQLKQLKTHQMIIKT